MLTKLFVTLNVLIFYAATTTAMIRQDDREKYPVDCSTLSECNDNLECIEFLISLYRLDCFASPVSKKSIGGGKRGGFKNLEKILLGSYLKRMR